MILFLISLFVCFGTWATPFWERFLRQKYGNDLRKRKTLQLSIPLIPLILTFANLLHDEWKSNASEKQSANSQAKLLEAVNGSGTLLHPAVRTARTLNEQVEIIFGSAVFGVAKDQVLGIVHWNGDSLVTVRQFEDRVYVSASIYNETGRLCAIIKDNKYTIEPIDDLRIQRRPASLRIESASGKLLFELTLLSYSQAKMTGVFYGPDGDKIVDSSDGRIHIDSKGDAGFGRSEGRTNSPP